MDENGPKRWLGVPLTAYLACAVAAAATAVGWGVVGANLGLLFHGVAVTLVLAATLPLGESKPLDQLIIAGAVVDGVGAVCLVAAFASPITIFQWLLYYILLIAWALAIFGVAHLLAGLFREPVPAGALVVALALVWITSPIWLKMQAPAVVPVHPLMVVNGIVPQLGLWTERPIAYRYLFNLGQDVPYELPHNIAGMVLVHGGVGLLALLGARFVGKR